MAQPTRNDTVLFDQVLTNMSLAYRNSQRQYIADRLFPIVPTEKESGQYATYDRATWLAAQMRRRAYGSEHPRAGYNVSSETFVTIQHSLEHTVPDELAANATAPFDLERDGVQWLTGQILIQREKDFVTDFMTSGVWTNTDNNSTTDWDDYTNGDPISDVLTAWRTIIRYGIPDPYIVAGMGLIVYTALLNHPGILDRMKYTQTSTENVVASGLAAVLGIDEVLVGEAVYNTAAEGATESISSFFDDDCLIVHAPRNSTLMGTAAGKTFTWEPGGGAGQMFRYREDKVESNILRAKTQYDQKVVSADAGYLFLDVV